MELQGCWWMWCPQSSPAALCFPCWWKDFTFLLYQVSIKECLQLDFFMKHPGEISAFNSIKTAKKPLCCITVGMLCWNTAGGTKQHIQGGFLGCETHKSSWECLPNSHFIYLHFPPGELYPAGTHQAFVGKPKTQNNPLHRGLKREFLSHGVGEEEKKIKNGIF